MQRKLKLALDDLSVESFNVSNSVAQGGTVRGQETGQWDVSCYSCPATCAGSCDFSCGCAPSVIGYCDTDFCGQYTERGGFSCNHTCQTCDYTGPRDQQDENGG